MTRLETAHVAAMAHLLGIAVAPGDIEEIAHRLCAFADALAALDDLALGEVEAVPLTATRPAAAPPAPGAQVTVATPPAGGTSVAADDLALLPAVELAALIRARQLSPVALVETYLERIDRWDGQLRAYIAVCRDEALREAKRAEQALTAGEALGPLHGVPFAVKDQFDAAGVVTTAGSRLLADRVAERDAPVVARLRAAGGILLGKLNLTEFALGGTLEFPFGQPRNPWALDRDPGGSSSGSAIAAAAGLAGLTLGEDTGGSIRGPASCCGVVGLRPTWGLVPRAGCFPLSWSMDAAGPIVRTVEDAALVTSIIAGPDGSDPFLRAGNTALSGAAVREGVRGLRAGLVRELVHGPDTDPEVRAAVLAAGEVLRGLGAVVDEVSAPLVPLSGAVFMAIADSEGAGLHLSWLRTRPADYDAGTRRRLLAAGLLPAAAYHQATRARALIRRDLLALLEPFDLLLAPTQPRPAPPIAQGQAPVTSGADAAARFFARRSYTTPFSLAGLPAISVPCGMSTGGLPIGLQIAGRAFDELAVLRAAWSFEQATPWHGRRPGPGPAARGASSRHA